ncbi:biopolymer transporter ExbD [Botrimarina sp.]|uniref:ExbD/TolR family protein n=1 Tax=Botrimarina sp. TaxID=2795802 RepID=UPI0032EBE3B4
MNAAKSLSESRLARRRSAGAGGDDVDITPMIDITFLLLIFFLVTSTPDQETAIELPEALHGDAVSQLESVVFTVAEGGLETAPVYAADGKVEADRLPEDAPAREEAILEAIRAGRDASPPKENVVIKADRGVAYRHVAAVVQSVSKAPGANIHLAVTDTD